MLCVPSLLPRFDTCEGRPVLTEYMKRIKGELGAAYDNGNAVVAGMCKKYKGKVPDDIDPELGRRTMAASVLAPAKK